IDRQRGDGRPQRRGPYRGGARERDGFQTSTAGNPGHRWGIDRRHGRDRRAASAGDRDAAGRHRHRQRLQPGHSRLSRRWIAFLSHDDLWAPGKLDLQLAALEADPELLLTFGLVRHVLMGPPPPGFRIDLLEREVPGYLMETMVA